MIVDVSLGRYLSLILWTMIPSLPLRASLDMFVHHFPFEWQWQWQKKVLISTFCYKRKEHTCVQSLIDYWIPTGHISVTYDMSKDVTFDWADTKGVNLSSLREVFLPKKTFYVKQSCLFPSLIQQRESRNARILITKALVLIFHLPFPAYFFQLTSFSLFSALGV